MKSNYESRETSLAAELKKFTQTHNHIIKEIIWILHNYIQILIVNPELGERHVSTFGARLFCKIHKFAREIEIASRIHPFFCRRNDAEIMLPFSINELHPERFFGRPCAGPENVSIWFRPRKCASLRCETKRSVYLHSIFSGPVIQTAEMRLTHFHSPQKPHAVSASPTALLLRRNFYLVISKRSRNNEGENNVCIRNLILWDLDF